MDSWRFASQIGPDFCFYLSPIFVGTCLAN
jgi:hypothetical protein